MPLTAAQQSRLDELENKYSATPAVDVDATRLQELEAKYPSASPQPIAPAPQPEVPTESPSALSQAKHVAKGLGETALAATIDLPHYLSTAARVPVEGAANMLGVELPNIEGSPSPFFGTFPKLSDKGFMKPISEAISGEEFDRDAAPIADTLRTGVEWAAGGLPNAARKLSTRPDLFMGAGAMVGQAIEDYAGEEGVLGEIAGGIGGLITAIRTGNSAKLAPSAKRAYEFLRANISDPEIAIQKLKAAMVRGEKGSLADLAQDQGAFNVEAGLLPQPGFKQALSNLEGERTGQIADEVSDVFGMANPLESAGAATGRVANRRAGIRGQQNQSLAQARAQIEPEFERVAATVDDAGKIAAAADEAAVAATEATRKSSLPLATSKRPYQTSEAMKKAIDDTEAAFVEAETGPKWKAFEAGPDIPIEPIQLDVSDLYKTMSTVEKTMFNEKYGRLFKYLKRKKDLPPKDAQAILRKMKAEINAAHNAGEFGDEARQLQEFVNTIEGNMGENSYLFETAKAATKEKYDRFYPEKLGKARNTPPERFAGKLGQAGEAGAESARVLSKTEIPAIPRLTFERLKALGQEEGITANFLRKYRDTIDSLPQEQRQLFDNYVERTDVQKAATKQAETTAKQAEKAQVAGISQQLKLGESLRKQQEKIRTKGDKLKASVAKTDLANYGTKQKATLKSLLSSTDGIHRLSRLQRKLESLGQGDSFKRAVGDMAQEKILAGGLTDDLTRQLSEGGILTKGELDDISRATSKMQSVSKRKQALEVHKALGSNELDNLISSGGAAIAMGALPSGHSLIMAGALRRYFKYFLKNAKTPKEIQALEEFALNPQSYLDAAAGAKSIAEANKRILTKVVGASQAAQAIEDVGE